MAKDKVKRDRERAFREASERRREDKLVRASPIDASGWSGPIQDARGLLYFSVMLLPPWREGMPWRVVCRGNDDLAMVRDFDNAERARAVYDGINDFTQRKTLQGRGFRYD